MKQGALEEFSAIVEFIAFEGMVLGDGDGMFH
jgi:hypothetical protein